jgi:Ala-tRNA(Pro) deacylase
MRDTHERIVVFLQEHKVPFEIINHPAAGSVEDYQRTMNTRLQQQAKALFVRYKKAGEKGFAIVALQGQKKADLESVRKLLHAKEIRLGAADQLLSVTGCAYGELPPMGKVFGLPLIMDKDLLHEPRIYFNAGSLTSSIILDPKQLCSIEHPSLIDMN